MAGILPGIEPLTRRITGTLAQDVDDHPLEPVTVDLGRGYTYTFAPAAETMRAGTAVELINGFWWRAL